MDNQKLIELAREAGMPIDDDSFIFQATRERVIRFAALVRAAALEEAAEYFQDGWASPDCYEIADAIRALKEKT